MSKSHRPIDVKTMAGLRLRAARLAIGVTRQADMAEQLKVSITAYNNYENGARLPDVYTMVRLLELTGIGPDWVYAGQLRGVPYDLATKLRVAASDLGVAADGHSDSVSHRNPVGEISLKPM